MSGGVTIFGYELRGDDWYFWAFTTDRSRNAEYYLYNLTTGEIVN